jgi:hypothetical protein
MSRRSGSEPSGHNQTDHVCFKYDTANERKYLILIRVHSRFFESDNLLLLEELAVHWLRLKTSAHFKTLGNPTRERGTVRKRLEYQSLAHASGYQMQRIEGFEMRSS